MYIYRYIHNVLCLVINLEQAVGTNHHTLYKLSQKHLAKA